MKQFGIFSLIILLVSCSRSTEPNVARKEPKPTPPAVKRELPTEGKKPVRVYFSDPRIEGLVVLEREIYDTTDQTSQVIQTIDLLTIPPDDPSQGIALWPPSTYAREVYLLDNRTIIVDLDSSFVSDTSAGVERETSMVDSMVRTILDNFDTFSHVQILLDGRIQETLLGHIDIEWPLESKNDGNSAKEPPLEEEIEVEDLLQ